MRTRWRHWQAASSTRGGDAGIRTDDPARPHRRVALRHRGRAEGAGPARLARQCRELRAAGCGVPEDRPRRHRPGRARPARPWRQRAPAARRGLFLRRRPARRARHRRCAGLDAVRAARPFDGCRHRQPGRRRQPGADRTPGRDRGAGCACGDAREHRHAPARCGRRDAGAARQAAARVPGPRTRGARAHAGQRPQRAGRQAAGRARRARGARRPGTGWLRMEQRPAPDPADDGAHDRSAGAQPRGRDRMPDPRRVRRSPATLPARTAAQ